MNGYIFRCTPTTYPKCMELMLFGESKNLGETIKKVKVGDVLFLYDVTVQRLYGEFEATSDGKFNIDERAWGGKFPWQVRVKQTQEYNPLRREDFEDVVKFQGKYTPLTIPEDQIIELRTRFEKAAILPSSEKEFREKFPHDKLSEDGHKFQSYSEVLIDNWLFHRDIPHGIEKKLPEEENLYCDFFFQLKENPNRVYMEFWGFDNTQSKKKSRLHNKLC